MEKRDLTPKRLLKALVEKFVVVGVFFKHLFEKKVFKDILARQVLVGALLAVVLILVIAIPVLTATHDSQSGKETSASTPGSTAGSTGVATGDTYYVSQKGNNTNGSSWATAWNEFGDIDWNKIQPGDTILVDGGGSSGMTYTTTLDIPKSGTANAPITIKMATDAGRNGQVKIFGGRSTSCLTADNQTITRKRQALPKTASTLAAVPTSSLMARNGTAFRCMDTAATASSIPDLRTLRCATLKSSIMVRLAAAARTGPVCTLLARILSSTR
ncbi:MAG TPA: hypothetical protein VFV38_12310 [Ktedonobacteraceae bacterium]|nr:hypothetical protein [Ktedonobacteraceae bacterium]